SQVWPVLLEPLRQPISLFHRSHPFQWVRHGSDGRKSAVVTSVSFSVLTFWAGNTRRNPHDSIHSGNRRDRHTGSARRSEAAFVWSGRPNPEPTGWGWRQGNPVREWRSCNWRRHRLRGEGRRDRRASGRILEGRRR